MRVYGKKELGEIIWKQIIQAHEEYTRLNRYTPDFLELTNQEVLNLNDYLKDFIPAVNTRTNLEDWTMLGMKIIIKD